MNVKLKLERFLQDRIFLIDICKKNKEVIFTIEETFKNYNVTLHENIITCSCDNFKNRQIICKHIKFIISKVNNTQLKKSQSYDNNLHNLRIFSIVIRLNVDINKFISDFNPRYKEYKIIEKNNTYNESNCYICLEKLGNKIIRCKTCNTYYHDKCIYGWLRMGSACTCPICKTMWI